MRMLLLALGATSAMALVALGGAARVERASDPPRPGAMIPSGAAPATRAPVEAARSDDPDLGLELIGQPAASWSFDRWIRTPPLTLAGLRGKVVLLRWWTEGCHYCATTLPELEAIRGRHAQDGLVVIGVFHPKPPRQVSDRHVLGVAKRLHFDGPIAVDTRWAMLDRYWLDTDPERNWTSVSFLIGRDGTIRWVHGGGEYHPSGDPRHARCDAQFRDFERALASALAEPPPKRDRS